MILDFSQNGITMIFEICEDNTVSLLNFSKKPQPFPCEKNKKWCNIADVHITGKSQEDHHGAKHTGLSANFTHKYVSHKYYKNETGNKLEFLLSDCETQITVHYQFYEGLSVVRSWSCVKNISDKNVGLEYVSSFCYTGLNAGDNDVNNTIEVYIPHSAWVRELYWKKNTLSELGFYKNTAFSTKRIQISNTGTWSTKEYLPLGAVTNTKTDTTIMWQIENNGSWQWEISDISDMLYLKLSGPTELENQWHKELKPGEEFTGVKAALCVGSSFEDTVCQMTEYRRKIMKRNPQNDRLPVIFNDYMHCLWADPTEEKMLPVIDKACLVGAEYYVMDAGWYADGTWWETVGEWQPVQKRFPNGIKAVFDYIKSKGMVPGMWFEIEVMGVNCPILDQFDDDCFFMRHGRRVIDHGRYQLDFRSEKVRNFATEVLRRAIEDYGVGYIKFDYNVEAGPGTENNADSFGDGLLGHNRAYIEWIKSLCEKYPDVIFENCSSGGMRIDYTMLSNLHLESMSDQEDYDSTAYISAASATAVVPEQSGIWSYPLKEQDDDAVVFNMVNSITQRICLGGEICDLSPDKFALVQEAIQVYKENRNKITGSVPYYPLGVPNYTNEWLCSGFKKDNSVRLSVWRVNSENDTLKIPVDFNINSVKILYPKNTDCTITNSANEISVKLNRKKQAVLLEII